ncbi:peptidoglycan-binding protein [Aurantimonas sp. Leaf443]|uniref:peptidoglycan-binding domain-containing protein n=1 Tax=Aurantimonas sp. Leaf443 TaxID=1736378 RepID=UPI000700C5A5|nr:peptidoglycan-binding protein [Aurantimonas sp. Leaf443]KQT88219.1 hypothetical protein ASG48_01935 [Aurantimonas sp. Leaf443]
MGLVKLVALRAALAVLRRPALSLGVAGFAALAGGLSANALYYQKGPHPHPMMTTRGTAETATAAAVPMPLVQAVQDELAEIGLYGGAVDGRPGILTEAAIRVFQKERNLTVDGQASEALLAALRERAPSKGGRDLQESASLSQRLGGLEETGSVAPVPAKAARVEPDVGALDREDLVRRIQAGLTAAQVADLNPDGVMGEKTRAAIRTFEALEGLTVTGSPEPRILERLIEIGAVQ